MRLQEEQKNSTLSDDPIGCKGKNALKLFPPLRIDWFAYNSIKRWTKTKESGSATK